MRRDARWRGAELGGPPQVLHRHSDRFELAGEDFVPRIVEKSGAQLQNLQVPFRLRRPPIELVSVHRPPLVVVAGDLDASLDFEPEVGPEARITSSRVITIFTGLPDFFERASATGSR